MEGDFAVNWVLPPRKSGKSDRKLRRREIENQISIIAGNHNVQGFKVSDGYSPGTLQSKT